MTVPVTMQDFNEPLSVDVVVGLRPSQAVSAERSGTITAWACTPGMQLESGKSSIAIDGVSLINLATTVPLWRDLTLGLDGADVAAVQQELVRLGYSSSAGGAFARADLEALAKLAGTAGTRVGDTFPRDNIFWIPGPIVTAETCEASLGATTSNGQALATVSADIDVQPVSLPPDRLPGARILSAFVDPVPLGENGETPTDLDSAMVRDSPAFRESLSGAPDASSLTIPGTVLLAVPVPVAAVPATAILVVDAQTSCVFAGTTAYPVSVVGSEFGNSFVMFAANDRPESVLSTVPAGARTCS